LDIGLEIISPSESIKNSNFGVGLRNASKNNSNYGTNDSVVNNEYSFAP